MVECRAFECDVQWTFREGAKISAARDLNGALEAGWSGFEISERVPLAEIARAHELVEHPTRPGRVVVTL